MALVLREPKVFKRIWGDFERQLKVQVLSDGFHFERSPMYHNLMLESLLRLIVALRGAQRANEAERIEDVACSMWGAMLSLERGLSKMPAFNDSADGVAKDCRALDKACRRLMGAKPRIAPYLADAGYARLECGRLVALFDAGDPTNEYSTGHAHCDELSYELYLDGEPFVVNAGTYAYQSELRPYFRSTAAHNTAQYEACEQHECWAEHRVARRGHRGVAPKVSQTKVFASFVSYEGHCHERRFAVGDRGVNVQDSFPLERKGNVSSYIHFAPGLSLKPLDDGRFFVCNASDEEVALLSLEAGESAEVVFDYVPVSREMGRLEQSLRVAFRAKAYGVSYSISFEVKGLETCCS